ncbi:MAG: hypothetical protein EG823_08745 [Actinobacteria bacterium]|nr:hypothetical protein [Actinomycetota bacterium]
MSERASRNWLVLAAALCVALALAGQALGDSVVPEASGAETDRAIGRAASSYLTGIRSYAAAALWNRLDPVMHGYYTAVSLSDQKYMLSTIAAVQALDPHAVMSYPVGSWILVESERVSDGILMARRGVEANPKSGVLKMNLAQLLMLYGDDMPGALEVAEAGLADDIVWTDAAEQYNSYAIFGSIFKAGGRTDLYDYVQAEIERIDAEAGD